MDTAKLILALGVPIVTAILAVISARYGIAGRIRRVELHERRLQVLKQIINDYRELLTDDSYTGLKEEIKFIADELLSTSPRFRNEQILNWNNQNWWKRYLTLPTPISGASWLATIIFYLYLVLAILYLLILPINIVYPNSDFPLWALLISFFGCIGLALLGRKWGLWIARNRILIDRAKAAIAYNQANAADAKNSAAD